MAKKSFYALTEENKRLKAELDGALSEVERLQNAQNWQTEHRPQRARPTATAMPILARIAAYEELFNLSERLIRQNGFVNYVDEEAETAAEAQTEAERMLQYEEQLEQLAVENSRLTEQLERKQSEKGELLEFKNRLLEERSQKIEELHQEIIELRGKVAAKQNEKMELMDFKNKIIEDKNQKIEELKEKVAAKQSEKGELLEFKNRLLEERSQKIEELARLNEVYTQSRLLRLIIRIFRIGRKKNRNAAKEDAE
ncbi:MAG: hypothetical protein ACLSAP_07255 [Oscillospiraceae bacterium]